MKEVNQINFEKLKTGELWVKNNRLFKFDPKNLKKLHHLQSLINPNEKLLDGNHWCYMFKEFDGVPYSFPIFGKAEYERHIDTYFVHRCKKCSNELYVWNDGDIEKCRVCGQR
jgi:hypothetical protein